MTSRTHRHLWMPEGSRIVIDAWPFWDIRGELAALESAFREATEPNLIDALIYRRLVLELLLSHEVVVARQTLGLDTPA